MGAHQRLPCVLARDLDAVPWIPEADRIGVERAAIHHQLRKRALQGHAGIQQFLQIVHLAKRGAMVRQKALEMLL
jgi:hypothetical protein